MTDLESIRVPSISEAWLNIETSNLEDLPVFMPLYVFDEDAQDQVLVDEAVIDAQLNLLAKTPKSTLEVTRATISHPVAHMNLRFLKDRAPLNLHECITQSVIDEEGPFCQVPLLEVYVNEVDATVEIDDRVIDLLSSIMFHLLAQRTPEARAAVGIQNNRPSKKFWGIILNAYQNMTQIQPQIIETEETESKVAERRMPVSEQPTAEHSLPTRSQPTPNVPRQPIRDSAKNAAQLGEEEPIEPNNEPVILMPEGFWDNNNRLALIAPIIFLLLGTVAYYPLRSTQAYEHVNLQSYSATLFAIATISGLATRLALGHLNPNADHEPNASDALNF